MQGYWAGLHFKLQLVGLRMVYFISEFLICFTTAMLSSNWLLTRFVGSIYKFNP